MTIVSALLRSAQSNLPLDGLRPLVLDMKEMQKVLGISRTTAYQRVHEEGFPAFRSGNRIKISKEALFEWMAKGRA